MYHFSVTRSRDDRGRVLEEGLGLAGSAGSPADRARCWPRPPAAASEPAGGAATGGHRDRHARRDRPHRRCCWPSAWATASGRIKLLGQAAAWTERQDRAARLGRPPERDLVGGAARRAARDVLGHLAPHRPGPRRRPARQPRPLPDPGRAVRLLHRRLPRDGPAARAARPQRGADHPHLARAGRRACCCSRVRRSRSPASRSTTSGTGCSGRTSRSGARRT